MSRNFGMMTSRIASRGQPQPGSLRGVLLPANSILPAPSPPLERSKVAQALINGLAVGFGILFICCTAASIPIALFILIFVGGR